MNTVNFLAGQNILWSIFCVSSETIFQQFTVFIKAELTQVFEMLRGKKCLGGRRVGRIWEANALLHYLWWIDKNNCGTLAGEAVEQNMWNELHLLIHSIYLHCIVKVDIWYYTSDFEFLENICRWINLSVYVERSGIWWEEGVYGKYTSPLQRYMENIPLLSRGIWKIYPLLSKIESWAENIYLLELPKRLQICMDDF